MNFLIGTVNIYTANKGTRVVIDGETVRTSKYYRRLSSYTPYVGDRVLILEIAGTYLILGKIIV